MLVKHALQRGGSMARAILVDMFYPKVCPGCGLRAAGCGVFGCAKSAVKRCQFWTMRSA